MSGGIVQLVATGAQDTWLTGKPEISFFRSNYKRYTHYSRSTERQIIQGNPSAGSISTIRFEKKGDLLSYVYFIGKDTTGSLIPGIDWSKVIDKIELLIGGQVVDTQDITWMTQIEPVTGAQNYSQRYLNNDLTGLTNVINGFLPLKFFFCKDWSVALPLVALQYHDVELRITWNQNLGYRVNYEIYSVPLPSSTATIPAPTAASLGLATTTTTGVSASGALTPQTVNIATTALTASQQWQPNAFNYSGATMQVVPGMYFASGIQASPNLIVVSVTPTSTTAGSFVGYLSATSTDTSLPAGSFTVAGYQGSAPTITLTAAFTPATGTQTGKAITWGATTTVPTVNTVLTSPSSGNFGTNALTYISAITITSSTGGTVSITSIGPTTAMSATSPGATATAVTRYPIVNLALAASPSLAIAPGYSVMGGVQAAIKNVQIPTVNTIYSSTLISINTNQFAPYYTAGTTPAAAVPMLIAELEAWFVSTTPVWFIPATFYTAVNGATATTVTTGNQAGGAPLALTPQYNSSVGPTLAGSVFFFDANQTMTNVYASSITSGTSIGISYTAAQSTTLAAYAQMFIMPNASARALMVAAQPYEDRGGSAIISVNMGAGSIATGQQVLGTQYSGPVTVSQVVSSSGSFSGGLGVALIEIQFPTQSTGPYTITNTLLTFIDPSTYGVTLPQSVTSSTTGFNGTYQQLQYEAWCSYLYLDGAEREYFASTPMDMVVTQVNRVPINPLSTHEVNLAHPVKFLAFVSNSYATAYATQSTAGAPPASAYAFKTQMNGVDVGDSRSLFQWQDVPQYYHTPYGYKAATGIAPVTIISYCLDTSKLQPTGTLNFSRLDSYRIITPNNSNLGLIAGGTSGYIYAVNYNILRIQKGMGSMLYSS